MNYRAPDESRFDRLISDSRHELFGDDWDMNEHFGGEINPPARGVGAARGGNNLMNQTLNDEDYKRALLESMKDAKPGDI